MREEATPGHKTQSAESKLLILMAFFFFENGCNSYINAQWIKDNSLLWWWFASFKDTGESRVGRCSLSEIGVINGCRDVCVNTFHAAIHVVSCQASVGTTLTESCYILVMYPERLLLFTLHLALGIKVECLFKKCIYIFYQTDCKSPNLYSNVFIV